MCGIELRKTCSLKGVMVHEASTALLVEPIGYVRCSRADAQDDHWDTETCRIELLHAHGPASVAGLADFSHIEVLYHFHKVAASEVVSGARHPRGNRAWPLTGIFAQRGRNRPNRLGTTLCRLLRVDGSTLYVAGLDAIDGTPVLDIKPVMSEFLPRGELRQPAWSHELMRDYWDDGANK
jgi:tRNA-Thr(GGU) m(6)t(6)A37 methyltransferase TsaA